ncbi:MAG: zinc carboxypeptidase [Solobacterium sp.]|nr:zinc carboxypeptidase [Solobacterium sp.]
MKTTFRYDHYYLFEELQEKLYYFRDTYPSLMRLENNCTTPGGLRQYAVTLTNTGTGDALDKPGWYLDGNIHAGEVTSSMAAMHTLDYLLTNYGTDRTCTYTLDEMTVYIIPRVSPDGAEKYLTTPYTLRSADREYAAEKGGIREEDIDGDGVIRSMAIPSRYGAWKRSGDSFVKRKPDDIFGEFFEIWPEGILEPFDGDENLKRKKSEWGLDFNRHFPCGWMPDHMTPGAGPYPLSSPETKALADFVLAHPNICGANIGHTSGGLFLYPPATRSAKTMPEADRKIFRELAAMGKEETGYVPMNLFDTYQSDKVHYDSGAFDDWMYQTQGIPAYTTEFWDLPKLAGYPFDWQNRENETDVKEAERYSAVINWVRENAPQYYSEWKMTDHPQFGRVYTGGLDAKHTVQNPPEAFLQKECENVTRFNLRFILASPKLTVDEITCEKAGSGLYRICVTAGNTGYLPTYLCEEAVNLKKDSPVVIRAENAEVISGDAEIRVRGLQGFAMTKTGMRSARIMTSESASARIRAEWLIRADEGDAVTVTVQNEKAGRISRTVICRDAGGKE